MTIFWLSVTFMTLVSLGLLVFPFLKYRVQLTDKLESNVVRNITIIILVLGLPILAISFYWKLGASQQIAQQQVIAQQNQVTATQIKKLGSLQHIIAILKQKLAVNPDGHGFYLLGRLYIKTQQFKESSEAFAKANELTPNQVEILLSYAESLYFLHYALDNQAKLLLEQVLKLQPNQSDAINLLAIDAYQHKDYAKAVAYWEQLLPEFQPGSIEQQKLLQMIAAAQKTSNSHFGIANIKN